MSLRSDLMSYFGLGGWESTGHGASNFLANQIYFCEMFGYYITPLFPEVRSK